MRGCQGNVVKDMGRKDLAMRSGGKLAFARVTVAPVATNLMPVHSLIKTGHEVGFRPGDCYIRHLKTDCAKQLMEANGVYKVEYDLVSYAEAPRPPPRG